MVSLVGILNVTPDSFSDGGEFINPEVAIKQAYTLFNDGARIVDVGAESTRPHAEVLTDEQEWSRLKPVLEVLLLKYPGQISLDSYHPATIKKAWAIGPIIINDITGFNDPAIRRLAVQHNATVIISHFPPHVTIEQAHESMPVTSVQQVKNELLAKAKILEDEGLNRHHIILDPGIGFGKTPEVNKQLLTFAELVPQYQVMIGYSRKRFLGDKRMELGPNLEAGRIAVASGATYLRVHDIASHMQIV